ncbi:MAG TPA: hypothetical protein VFG04_24805 [Planctomycetaceae bacterium]|jgi:hypothetical protein|nr:hypothetical protein [Planctomycetaceae bacterium]
MSRLDPIWTAGRLNEALAKAEGDIHLDLGPDGKIDTFDDLIGLSPQTRESQREMSRRHRGTALVQPITGADEFDKGLRQLPPLLALLSINPEPWCRIQISPGALDSVGLFFDYTNPLWEWLVRAARAGRAHLWPFRNFPTDFGSGRENPALDKDAIPLPGLVHGGQKGPPAWLRALLEDFELVRIAPKVQSNPDAIAVAAGLMEMHDLGASHELAQSIEGQGQHRAGDYWHAIHHRREPDASNAKYWFRKVGSHPIHEALAIASRSFLSVEVILDQASATDKVIERLAPNGVWDSFAFVDFCNQSLASKDSRLVWIARQLQFLEMTLLLDSAYEDATTDAGGRS